MNKLYSVIKNELIRYFISPLAYVYLISFLILNGAAAFYFGHFFERGQANLEPMFWYQPWLYLLFIPGISMRLWAEEFRQKTVIQMMTMPVSAETLVWGKFFASWLFAGLALFLTFPFWISVNILGTPDNTVILSGYIGSFVLAGCMLAISQTMSSLTKNQVIALVLSVLANLMFFWSGIEFILSFFRLFSPDYFVDTIASFSFLTHFSGVIQGLVELRDILFALSIILLFNFTTVLVITFRTSGTSVWLRSTSRAYYITAWSALLLLFTGFNILANNLTRDTQLDLTEDKVFTLNDNTKNLLRDLPEPIIAKLYFSNILQQRNPLMRQMFDRVRALLEQYKRNANGRFDYRIYHPEFLDSTEDRAIADGIQPIPLIDINQNALFGLTLTDSLENKQVIAFFTPERISFLETDLTSKIAQMVRPKKKLAVLSSLPINGENKADNMLYDAWEVSRRLEEFYHITYLFEPDELTKAKFDALIIVHPQNLSDEMVEAIKKYSRNNGKILLLLDATAEAPRLYSPVNKPYEPSDLKGLDRFWGFRYYPEYVVADLENSITVDATSNYKNNPAFTQDIIQFKLKKKNFNPHHPVTKHLQTLLMSSASIILPLEDANVDFTALMQASKNSALMPVSVVTQGLNPRQILSFFKADQNAKVVAAAITGKNPDNSFRLIVVGDTDFIYDNFWASSKTVLDQVYYTPLFNNIDFVLNALDYLTNDSSLLDLRAKNTAIREFGDIENLRKNNVFKYKVKEEEIFNRMDQAKKELEEIWSKKDFEERETFTADELSLITGIRHRLDALRRDLSQIRLQTNQDIEKIALKYKFFNIFGIPLLISLILLIGYFLGRRKTPAAPKKFLFNGALQKLLSAALVVFALGIASIYLTSQSEIEKYEDKLVFPDLGKQINDISEIRIKTHDQTLTFIKQDNLWTLKEHPEFPVYQRRILSFLSTMLEARFYEKKSDKAENLKLFGLQPIEVENSPNTRIELYAARTNSAKPVLSFEIGKYDMDLGRGSKAAYLKFDNTFQVWMINADFIDLTPDWNEWTYSKMWDLRFGRLKALENRAELEKMVQIIKLFINVPFISAQTDFSKENELLKTEIMNETDDRVGFTFYEKDEKYCVEYTFAEKISQSELENFSKYAKNRCFEISKENWEKIKNVLGK